jgi:type IV pilus assembly protein PilB
MKKIISKQLGELLVDCKLITPQQFEEAIAIQKDRGGLLGYILVSLEYVHEEDIAQALTAQYGFPYLPLGSYEIDSQVAKIVPEHVAKQYGLIAVDLVGSILTVAMSNPLNIQAIEDIELITHYKVQVFVTTSSDVLSAIKQIYKV